MNKSAFFLLASALYLGGTLIKTALACEPDSSDSSICNIEFEFPNIDKKNGRPKMAILNPAKQSEIVSLIDSVDLAIKSEEQDWVKKTELEKKRRMLDEKFCQAYFVMPQQGSEEGFKTLKSDSEIRIEKLSDEQKLSLKEILLNFCGKESEKLTLKEIASRLYSLNSKIASLQVVTFHDTREYTSVAEKEAVKISISRALESSLQKVLEDVNRIKKASQAASAAINRMKQMGCVPETGGLDEFAKFEAVFDYGATFCGNQEGCNSNLINRRLYGFVLDALYKEANATTADAKNGIKVNFEKDPLGSLRGWLSREFEIRAREYVAGTAQLRLDFSRLFQGFLGHPYTPVGQDQLGLYQGKLGVGFSKFDVCYDPNISALSSRVQKKGALVSPTVGPVVGNGDVKLFEQKSIKPRWQTEGIKYLTKCPKIGGVTYDSALDCQGKPFFQFPSDSSVALDTQGSMSENLCKLNGVFYSVVMRKMDAMKKQVVEGSVSIPSGPSASVGTLFATLEANRSKNIDSLAAILLGQDSSPLACLEKQSNTDPSCSAAFILVDLVTKTELEQASALVFSAWKRYLEKQIENYSRGESYYQVLESAYNATSSGVQK